MTAPVWQTKKNLGIVEENVYFEIQLEAASSDALSFSLISGEVPSGIQVSGSGLLHGIPTRRLKDDANVEKDYTAYFTVRAQDTEGNIADRTFNLFVSGVEPPTIISDITNLGTYFDGTYYRNQLLAYDEYPDNLTWKIVRGHLPRGITMSSNGLMEGFFLQNLVDTTAFSKKGWDKTEWDIFIWDYISSVNDSDYQFTVEVSDGINYSQQTYLIRVIARDLLTADRDHWIPFTLSGDITSKYITADTTPRHLPFISTMPQTLPEIRIDKARQNTYFSFKFDAIDFDNDEVYYEITSPDQKGFDQDGDVVNHRTGTGFDNDEFDGSDYPMPLYVGLNNETGWYTGQLSTQLDYQKEYTFQVYARKRNNLSLAGYKSTFHVSVLGQVEETITWLTGGDLGEIENGTVSSLRIEAMHNSGRALQYRLATQPTSRTPQGIKLMPDGMLSGRCTFNYYKNDSEETTYDNESTTFDSLYKFTVVASTADGSAVSSKTFTLKVKNSNKIPYENLYLRGFPSKVQRQFFNSIISNQELFPNDLIYRINDPWYGKATEMRFLAVPGVRMSTMAEYRDALVRNHYTKILRFGEIKTATALDKDYNVAYEVVYLEILDENEGVDPVTGLVKPPAQTIDISYHKNTFLASDDPAFKEITPNALKNMENRIKESLESVNVGSLPLWMTSPQPDPEIPGHFTVPLGYVRAVPLAYTLEGGSKLIAYRLKQAQVEFNKIEFKFDRYQLDKALSENYDFTNRKFIAAEECTFDQTSSVADRYRHKGEVDYAVSVPFAKIHGRTVDYIRFWASMDGDDSFVDGETLIFLQQEKFESDPFDRFIGFDSTVNRINIQLSRPRFLIPYKSVSEALSFDSSGFDYGRVGYKRWLVNDGIKIPFSKWFYWTDGWMTELPFESDLYSQNPYSKKDMIPGYVDKILYKNKNLRAAVYQIKIDENNIVTLKKYRETEPGDIVTIKKGGNVGKEYYFEAYTKHGNVPRWWPFTDTLKTDPTDVVAPKPVQSSDVYFYVSDGYDKDFVIKLSDPVKIANARNQLNGTSPRLGITGLIVKSKVWYNPNYSFHYDPATIDFFELAAEVCDSTFDYTENHLADVGGSFLPGNRLCPWNSFIVEEIPPILQANTGSYDEFLVKEHKETTFDSRGTRFFSNRDHYGGPETNAKYIKFPKFGVFI